MPALNIIQDHFAQADSNAPNWTTCISALRITIYNSLAILLTSCFNVGYFYILKRLELTAVQYLANPTHREG